MMIMIMMIISNSELCSYSIDSTSDLGYVRNNENLGRVTIYFTKDLGPIGKQKILTQTFSKAATKVSLP